MPLAPDSKLGRYTVERLLGSGGMGTVYAAVDASLGRRVALKVLNGPETGEARARLLREARAAAAVEHPNVVAIHDAGEIDGTAFIAMELVDGRTLREAVGDASVPLSSRLRWLLDVAQALAAAHERGVVHRDVKPSNVIVREDGSATVLDFGVARASSAVDGAPDLPTITREGSLVGTAPFMAPELLAGEGAGAQTDQFAWGVLAHQLLTGSLPWRGPDVGAAIALGAVAPFRDRVPGLPAAVESIVLRALAGRPSERFASMRDVAHALETGAAQPSTTRTDTTGFGATQTRIEPPPPRPRSRLSYAAAAGALLAGVAFLGARGLPASQPPSAAPSEAPAPSAPKPVTVTDLPLPTTSNVEALTSYRAAMQALRDGAYATAIAGWSHAATLDPSLAAAHLRLSIATFYAAASEARAHFQRAVALRSTLSEHDQALLEAFQPYIQQQPSDLAERERRLRAAVQRFPADADLALYLGRAAADHGDLASIDRAIAIDPEFGLAYGFKAQFQAYAGDLDGALGTIEDCLKRVPGAMFCVSQRTSIDTEEGNTARLEADARSMIAHDPSIEDGYYRLASATLARGGPPEAVRAAIELAWARLDPADRPRAEAEDGFALAVLAGDFVGAEREARRFEALVAHDESRPAHAAAARHLAELYLETGRDGDAARIAEDYLQRQDAWVPDPRVEDLALMRDATPFMLATLRRADRLPAADFAARRDRWVAGWRPLLLPLYQPFLWIHAHAAPADTAEDAAQALAALSAAGETPPRYAPETLAAADVGRVYLRAGRLDAAVTELHRATRACLGQLAPFAHVKAHLWLGEALAAKGDAPGACAAYSVVLERWGHAQPRSRSAALALAESRRLACPPKR